MAKMLELPDSVYEALTKACAATGVTPSDWIASSLLEVATETLDDSEPHDKLKSLHDLLKGRIGKFKSVGDGRWSEDCGKKFAEGMEEKRKAGHL